MPTKSPYENQLRHQASPFIQSLNAHNLHATIDEASFREYHVKLVIPDAGNIILYYKPSKKTYTLSLHEIKDKSQIPMIEKVWQELDNAKTPAKPSTKSAMIADPKTEYYAYVDGSYLAGKVGYGAVILRAEKEVKALSGQVHDAGEIRQVAGEIQAVIETITYCQQNNISAITIYYDYVGLEKWATKRWQAKDPRTQAYRDFIASKPIKITWVKVAAHSGHRWNDRADALAKAGTTAR